jgi:hypothetical protein
MHAIAKTYQPLLPRVAAALGCLCAIAVFLYAALLLETVAHAAGRETAERQIESINAQLSGLEGQYLQATQAITPQEAVALGFVPAQNVTTIEAAAPLAPLSLR